MALKRRDILAHRDIYTLVGLLLFVALCVIFRRFSIDDAFISYRYAMHLSEGLGPVMNVGERVEGVSNLPWVGLIGLVSAAGLEPHSVGPVLAVLCGFLCIGLVAELAARWFADNRAGGVTALLFAATAPVAVWSLSGMETLIYTFLLIVLFLRLGSGMARSGHGLDVGVVLGMVAAMRPEGIIFAVPVAIAELSVAPRQLQRLLRIAAGVAMVLVPFLLFRFFYYGDWLPNTVYAKATFGTLALASGAVYLAKMIVAFPMFFVGACGATASALERPQRILLVGWIFIQLLFAVLVGGERFPGYRFLLPALPALALAGELSLRSWRQNRQTPSRAWSLILLPLVALGLLLCVSPVRATDVGAAALAWLRTYRDASEHTVRLIAEARFLGIMLIGMSLLLLLRLRFSRALLDLQPVTSARSSKRKSDTPLRVFHESNRARRVMAVLLFGWLIVTLLPVAFDPTLQACRQADPAARLGRVVGEWLRNNTPDSTLVATNAAGSLAYFSERPVIDMLGLTDAHIARSAADSKQPWIGHEKGDGAYVLGRRPHMIILGGPEGSETPWPFPSDQAIAASPALEKEYALQRVPLQDFEFVFFLRRDLFDTMGSRTEAFGP